MLGNLQPNNKSNAAVLVPFIKYLFQQLFTELPGLQKSQSSVLHQLLL